MAKNDIFNTVPVSNFKRSAFDLSYSNKLTGNFGKLIPVMCQEVLPGDTFKNRSDVFVRLAPMISPIMDRIDVYMHYFYVPTRIIWDDFGDFITGGKDGTLAPAHPYITMKGYFDRVGASIAYQEFLSPGSLTDFLGYPNSVRNHEAGLELSDKKMSSLPLRAYQLIYNEYYRDQNLTDEVFIPKGSGDDSQYPDLFELRYRSYQKDYFTSALPWAQRGPEVTLPQDSRAPVTLTSDFDGGFQGQQVFRYKSDGDLVNPGFLGVGVNNGNVNNPTGIGIVSDVDNDANPAKWNMSGQEVVFDPNGTLEAILRESSVTINQLRQALILQKWYERAAIGGARYREQILSQFGVRISDYKVEVPEYLGGGVTPVVISEVVQQAGYDDVDTGDATALGSLAGKGISAGNTNTFSKYFEEHGYIIGIMSIMPKASYQQGLPRHLTRLEKFDYAFPVFGHLGEQEVYNYELYFDPFEAEDDPKGSNNKTFGYQSRYAEYKFNNNQIHGDFKTNMNYWHLGRVFGNRPLLNQSFVECRPDESNQRIFNVTAQGYDKFWIEVFHNLRAVRKLPRYGTPML